MGVFATIIAELTVRALGTEVVMIDATHLKTHRTAPRLAAQKGGVGA